MCYLSQALVVAAASVFCVLPSYAADNVPNTESVASADHEPSQEVCRVHHLREIGKCRFGTSILYVPRNPPTDKEELEFAANYCSKDANIWMNGAGILCTLVRKRIVD